jgi:hypothetical protein
MKSLAGITLSSGVYLPILGNATLQFSLGTGFYCTDFELRTVISGASLDVSLLIDPGNGECFSVEATQDGDVFRTNFTSVLPDQAQLISKLQVSLWNYGNSLLGISSLSLNTVDYPIDYNYQEFSIAASSYGNAEIDVTNNSIQGTEQDIRVMPIYSGDYNRDRVFVLTASGKADVDKYHVDRGINLPEHVPWDGGVFANTMVSGRSLTLSGTVTSGSWISPVIYVSDPNYMSLYVYSENEGDRSGVERDWLSIDKVLEIRASDETPLPNFLINQWTYKLHTLADDEGRVGVDSFSAPDKRQVTSTTQEGYAPTSEYWMRQLSEIGCAYATVVAPCPYIFGRSDRIYMKGDGTIIAQASPDINQMGARDYWTGIPYKNFGAINKYWNAATFFGLLGEDFGYCTIEVPVNPLYNRLTYTTPYNTALWDQGKDVGTDYLKQIYPFKSHAFMGGIGLANDPVYFEYIGSTTIPKPKHPNEWIVVTAIMYPCDAGAEKYMCLYLLNVRNGWTSESKLLGIYGVGQAPADEGYAVCSCSSADDDEGGFWMHVGYSTNTIGKYTGDGFLVTDYAVKRGYNALRESPEAGCLWAIRNDGVFYYKENTAPTTPTLDVQFKVESTLFQYLQAGDVDEVGNLWVVDRDTATVYRINLATRSVDYTNHIPYAMGVWPHPTDGSAFVYIGFHSDSFTPVIKRVWVDDPYQTEEVVTEVPSLPLSDWSGAQFTGKLSGSYISPGVNDPIFGSDDRVTLEWKPYVNTSLTIPPGKYKQFRLTFRRDLTSIDSPRVNQVRIPLPLVLNNVPYGSSDKFYVNPHLRYDIETGNFNMDLLTWWEH